VLQRQPAAKRGWLESSGGGMSVVCPEKRVISGRAESNVLNFCFRG